MNMRFLMGIDNAVAGFAGSYGRAPDVVWSAPGRVNLIGEHTDYNEGLVLPFAISQRTTVAAAPRPGGSGAERERPGAGDASPVITVRSALFAGSGAAGQHSARLADIAPGVITGWAAYPLGVAWALSRLPGRRVPAAGIDIFIDSDVPAGSGLSSSAALENAVAGALNELWGLAADDAELAHASQLAENVIVGAPTGIMDQFASLLGEDDSAVFLDCRTEEAEIVPLGLREAGLELMLIDTGQRHSNADGGYADRRAACERAARALGVRALRDVTVADLPRAAGVLDPPTFRRARHVVTENARVAAAVSALREGDPAAVGALMTASHASMRDDFAITTPALDLAVESALRAGALGARMTGGGFGGSVIALVPDGGYPAIDSCVREAFAEAALPAPVIQPVTPSRGARREELTAPLPSCAATAMAHSPQPATKRMRLRPAAVRAVGARRASQASSSSSSTSSAGLLLRIMWLVSISR
jgi:galactokinase